MACLKYFPEEAFREGDHAIAWPHDACNAAIFTHGGGDHALACTQMPRAMRTWTYAITSARVLQVVKDRVGVGAVHIDLREKWEGDPVLGLGEALDLTV